MPLPPGLTLDRDTGVISGVPTVAGAYAYGLVARDAQGSVRVVPVNQTISPYDPPRITGTPGQYATRTVPYNFVPGVVDGVGPFTWSLASGTLPAGLTLDTVNGQISGTPSDTSYVDRPLTLRVVDSLNSSHQLGWTLRYRNQLTTAYNYPVGVQGEAYSATPTFAGGHAPMAWALTSGTVPPGLSFDTATGRIFGTPTTIGSSSVTITGTDAAGNQIVLSQSLQVIAAYVPLAFTGGMTGTSKTYQRASGTEVISPSSTLATTGGAGAITYSWARQSGSTKISAAAATSLSTGFNCSASAGENVSAVFRVTATDGISSATYDVTITGNNTYVFPVLSGSPPLVATRNKPYSGSFTLSGGKNPVSYAIVAGTLPAGLSINSSTGVISGTPTDTTYTDRSITVRVTDAESQTNDRSYTLQYRNAVSLGGAPPPGYTTQPYSFAPAAAGGHLPYTFTLETGTLPAGTSLNASTGVVSGTATTAATYNYTLRLTDADGNTTTQAYTTTVNAYAVPSLSGTYQGWATRTKAYSSNIMRNNGLAPFTYAAVSGSIPPGLSLNTGTGEIFGTPSDSSWGGYSFIMRVTDALGNVANSGVQNITYRNTPTMTSRALAPRTRTQAINESVATGASPLHDPIAYSIVSGSLPTGASLNSSTGQITGTLSSTSYGNYSATIRATDINGSFEQAAFTLAYANAISSTNSGTSLEGESGYGWSSSMTAAGGFPGYTYAVISGALPSGVSLNASTGAITGTVTGGATSGSYVIRATDTVGNTTDTPTINWTVYAQLTRTAQWGGGAIYRATSIGTVQGITVTGGKASIGYSVASGALPAGVSLNAGTGQLTGTPTTVGAYSFTLRATDALGITVDTTTISGTVSEPVALTNQSVFATNVGATATAGIRLGFDGVAATLRNGGAFPISGQWLLGGSAADYDARWTTTSGTLSGGNNGVWENLGNTRQWTRNRTVNGVTTCWGTLEIRPAGGGATLVSATIDLTAEVAPGEG